MVTLMVNGYQWLVMIETYLVGGFNPTPLKNDGLRQWEGLIIAYIKWKNNPNVANHQPVPETAFKKLSAKVCFMAH